MASLQVDVRDAKNQPVPDADVVLRPHGNRDEAQAVKFDDLLMLYRAEQVPAGEAVLQVEHSAFEGQEREVRIDESQNDELFLLAEPGVPTYFRERVRVPVNADPNLIAVALHPRARQARDKLDAVASDLGLEPEEIAGPAEALGVLLYRSRNGGTDQAIARLSEHELVEHAGAVVGVREENGFSGLTRDIVVRFRGPRGDDVEAIAEEFGCEVEREVRWSPETYVLRTQRPATLEQLDLVEKLAARDDVEWAEPNLVVSPQLDAITPTDPLWQGLWDRQLIGCPDGWQELQDAGINAFGDPDIVLAVWDSGTQTAGGVPTNPDFQGTVSDGSPKVVATYDFVNLVANNDAPWDNHGSGVAGVSVAKANNPSPLPGESHGLCGSAPNVRTMLITGTASTDVYIGDQYLWMAGFDPGNPALPAPPARGADVITCSLTPGAGAPLSGTARATLDFVTTYGRGGKGCMCFFSTGNGNFDNVTGRPYGAYEKCFGIAATSFANDGTTEIRAPYSGHGRIALAAPSQDQYPAFHNPPAGFAPWGAHHLGQGNIISYRQLTTTLTAASAAGATTLTVADDTGLAAGQVIHVGAIGAVGSEPARISAVNAATNQLTVQGWLPGGPWGGGLVNAHAAGDPVAMGPANHKNNFGGTSSATPLAAGAAALVLSGNPDLTWVEAREILRDTAVKFDLANTDPVGQWLDAAGNPSVTSGLPEVRSGWYGYGRVDVGAAVQISVTSALTRDLVIRDNLGDTGAVAVSGAFWSSPDIWCRRLAPASDPGALPGSYAAAGPHEDPKRGQPNWIYARVKNVGTTASLDAWVRLSITHWPGLEFTYPASWQPTHGPGDPLPSPMTPGTYFIGEAKITGLAAGGDQIVSVQWPTGLIPPADVIVSGSTVHWHPCLLAEITPHDGPAPTGNHVWDDNNLAQKNISIVAADSSGGDDFAAAMVVGNEENDSDHVLIEVVRGRLPRQVQLYIDLVDPALIKRLRREERRQPRIPSSSLDEIRGAFSRGPRFARGGGVATLPRELAGPATRRRGWRLAEIGGRTVVLLDAITRSAVPIYAGPGALQAIVIGGSVGKGATPGEYEVAVIQRDPSGAVSGSAAIQVTVRR
jgi:hypothetical protein